MADSRDYLGAAILVMCAVLLVMGGFTTGYQMNSHAATEAGAARWVANPETGELSLEWCDCFKRPSESRNPEGGE